MSLFEEVDKLEEYVIDLKRHIWHLQQWYVNDEHRDLKSNRALLAQAESDLEALIRDCKTKSDEGLCDDSFRICVKCDNIIGDGYVFNDESYCSECFHEQHDKPDVEQMFDSDEAYWTAWY